eukprot:COSAG02_NODE_240_length_27672_cov_67.291445_18_plen_109_part_00
MYIMRHIWSKYSVISTFLCSLDQNYGICIMMLSYSIECSSSAAPRRLGYERLGQSGRPVFNHPRATDWACGEFWATAAVGGAGEGEGAGGEGRWEEGGDGRRRCPISS